MYIIYNESTKMKELVKKIGELSIPLIVGIVAALAWANIDSYSYNDFIYRELAPGVNFHFLVNDVFLVLFFGSVSIEIVHGVAPGGMLFTNASLVENPGTAEGFTQILLPVSEIAVEVGSVRSVNMVMLGAVIAKTKLLKRETIMAVLEETMGRKKPELLEFNIKAFNAGYEAAGKGE